MGSIEEEVRKYYEYQNREILFQLARIEDEINHINKRIEMSSKEKEETKCKRFLSDFIKEMKSELEDLHKQKAELSTQKIMPSLTSDNINYLHDKLRIFISSLKSETPEQQQHILLKDFIKLIVPNKISGGYKLIYKLEVPSENSSGIEIILEKTLYFN